jgi:hypothetical protein
MEAELHRMGIKIAGIGVKTRIKEDSKPKEDMPRSHGNEIQTQPMSLLTWLINLAL